MAEMKGCHLSKPLSIEAEVIDKHYTSCINVLCPVFAALNGSPQMPGPCMRRQCKWDTFLTD